ncbi:MAG: hypothetical protein PWP37_201 [Thermotogota bacterium]|nr:hypothetical protein [Thermotogota bacterium]MDK2864009.1 hypothetical protein [Thermotogota bacterium]HCZ06528.1 hypothetical protein [Thermotogota bacterium]
MKKIVFSSAFLLLCVLVIADSGFVIGGSLFITEEMPQLFSLGIRIGWANPEDDEMLVDISYHPNAEITEGASTINLIQLDFHFALDMLGRDDPFTAGLYIDHERSNVPESISTETFWMAKTLAGIKVGGKFENFEISVRAGYPLFSQTEWNLFDTLTVDLKTYFTSKKHRFRDWLLMGVELKMHRFKFYVELIEPL